MVGYLRFGGVFGLRCRGSAYTPPVVLCVVAPLVVWEIRLFVVLPIRWQWALRGGERVVALCVRETGTGECPLR